jgi:hypothetical protein
MTTAPHEIDGLRNSNQSKERAPGYAICRENDNQP